MYKSLDSIPSTYQKVGGNFLLKNVKALINEGTICFKDHFYKTLKLHKHAQTHSIVYSDIRKIIY